MLCAACEIAFIPLAQTLFTVVQFTSLGKPANLAACLAGACPRLACITQPINTSCTAEPGEASGLIPAFANAPLIAAAPSLVADKSFNEPPKLPIGVRTAEIIYTSFI